MKQDPQTWVYWALGGGHLLFLVLFNAYRLWQARPH